MLRLIPGETHILRLEQVGRVREIALNPVIFRIQGKELLLISLKNIHSVLENNEIEAWQKLIRVLTHEIMNSLAPIISLSETLTERVARTTTEDATSPVMLQALEAIHRRSKGLLEFVQNYRKLTRIPAPELVPLSLEELFTGLRKLHATSVIPCEFICHDPRLQIQADRTQIEQVLLNLIRNAEEALSGYTGSPDPHHHPVRHHSNHHPRRGQRTRVSSLKLWIKSSFLFSRPNPEDRVSVSACVNKS